MTQTWHPIKTAPKNTPILVTDGKVIVVVECTICGSGDKWPDSVGFGGHEWEWAFEWNDLTHWMPLPKLPRVKGR